MKIQIREIRKAPPKNGAKGCGSGGDAPDKPPC